MNIKTAYIPKKRKTKNVLQWMGYIDSKLKESRGFDKHKKQD